MNAANTKLTSPVTLTSLKAGEPLGQQIGFGLVGIVLFTLFGAVSYSAGGEFFGIQAVLVKLVGLGFFVLALLAAYGTVHVGLSARVKTPTIDLSSTTLERGQEVPGRLTIRGPAKLKRLSVSLTCTQTEFEHVTRETLHAATDSDGPYETEDIVIERGERELCRMEVLSLRDVRVRRGDEITEPLSIQVPDDAQLSGTTEVSPLESLSVNWHLLVECHMFGPNNKQTYEVVVR